MAPQMKASNGMQFCPWTTKRADENGEILMEIAEDLPAEGKGLAGEIRRYREGGIPFHEQAVLCRTHTSLERMGHLLEAEGIPVLYLGNLFERPEIRDLLALLSLASEPEGRALLRVSAFPEYAVSQEDVCAFLHFAHDAGLVFPEALAQAGRVPGLSAAGKAGLVLLDGHLQDLAYGTSPWTLLSRYLFERSAFLQPILADTTCAGDQRRLALYQFLEYVREQSRPQSSSGDAKRLLLEHVRRLVRFGEANHLFELPDIATSVDAVRLLTVHASKGLEFRAVYLPILGGAYFPQKKQRDDCPPPPGLAPLIRDTDHDEEEECLFFVGLSRAKDVLGLSRATHYGRANSAPTKFLSLIGASLPRAPKSAVTWPGTAQPSAPESTPVPVGDAPLELEIQELDVYLQCPQQFYYQTVLGLGGGSQDTAFLRYHRCVHAVLNWLEEAHASGTPVNQDQILAELEHAWQQEGPVGHAFEAVFHKNAAAMLVAALEAQGATPARGTARTVRGAAGARPGALYPGPPGNALGWHLRAAPNAHCPAQRRRKRQGHLWAVCPGSPGQVRRPVPGRDPLARDRGPPGARPLRREVSSGAGYV